jgi:hypothetical protein
MTSKISAVFCVGATLVFLAFAATPALASSRVFLREIKETTPGSALVPSGIAVQERNELGKEKNDLWVEDNGETLAEFGPVSSGNPFLELLPKPPLKPPLEGPDRLNDLAVEDGSEDFYVVGGTRTNGGPGTVVVYNHEGKMLRQWEKAPGEPFGLQGGTVTVDNAPQSLADPSGCAMGECTVYVTEENSESGGIEKFDSAGHPVPFTYDAECATEHCEYVSGNKITGIPGRPTPEAFGVGLKEGLAVDAKGDIYAINNSSFLVYEYAPSGRFLRSFDLTSPEVPEVHEKPNSPTSVAVDPVTGHLLVGVGVIFEEKLVGAIDEFETEGAQAGKFVAQITEKSGGEGLGFVKALSVDSNGDVYGVEEQHNGHRDVVVYGPDVFPPILTLAAATHRAGTGALLSGTVDPNGFKLTQCEFQYVSEAAFKANDLDAVQTVTLTGATGGTFGLALEGQGTVVSGSGDLVGPATGTGEVIEGSNTITGVTTTGAFVAGEAISGAGIQPGTTIRSVQSHTIVLSEDATASGGAVALSAVSDQITGVVTSAGTFAAGEQIEGAGIPAASTITKVAGATITLSADVTASGSGIALSAALAYDASAAQVQSALEGLSVVGAGNVAVSGEAGGPYKIEFVGSRAHTAVAQLGAGSSGLTPAGASVAVATTSGGGDGWGTAASRECEPHAGEIPVDTEPHEVKAQATGLTPGETYHYRLLAHNEEPRDGNAATGSLVFTAPAAPGIVATSAENLSSTFADLHAQLVPHGIETSYRFEYDTRPYGEGEGPHGTSVPIPDESIGLGGPMGGAVESVVQHVGPLAPASTYYYRVVAENAQGVTSGGVCEGEAGLRADCTFVTLPAAVPGLPDGRAYELVTPATKEGGSDLFNARSGFDNVGEGVAPAESGEALLFETYSPFGPFPSAGFSAYVFRRVKNARGELEWAYTSLADPSRGVQTINETVFDPADLSRVGVNDVIGSTYTEEGAREESLLGGAGGPYTTLHLGAVFHEDVGSATEVEPHEKTLIGAGSRDLRHVVLESEAPAGQSNEGCPGAKGVLAGAALCEAAGGESKLVNVKPGSESEPVSSCGARLGSSADPGGGAHQAVSADGSRVFFTAPAVRSPFVTGGISGSGCWKRSSGDPFGTPGGNAPQVYARIDATSTLEISEPEAGVTEPGSGEPGERPVLYPADFVGASEDGREVFFVTETWLTTNHPEGHDPELYECEIVQVEGAPKCALSRVSVPSGAGGAAEPDEGGQVFAVQAVASEGGAVYFLAFGALAPGASKREVKEWETGAPVNLYRYQPQTAAAPARTAYVASVSTHSRPGESGGEPACKDVGAFGPCTELNWYTTPDGRYLLFYSELDLTANAHTGGLCHVKGSEDASGPCGVLYRYDAQAAEQHEQPLVCVSCDPNGGVTTAAAEFTRSFNSDPSWGPVRAMSNNGEYVFFDTPMPLVPGATNGSLNVYEWHDGVISLLNSGSEPGPSFFLGYSPYVTPGGEMVEGGNVFIGTHDRLVAADTNTVGNIYDARVCVPQSPCIQPPPGETAQCEGASCQTPAVPPAFTAPSTLTRASSGNIASEPQKIVTKKTLECKKKNEVTKKVKKKEICVKQPKRKSKAKKSNHGRAGR